MTSGTDTASLCCLSVPAFHEWKIDGTFGEMAAQVAGIVRSVRCLCDPNNFGISPLVRSTHYIMAKKRSQLLHLIQHNDHFSKKERRRRKPAFQSVCLVKQASVPGPSLGAVMLQRNPAIKSSYILRAPSSSSLHSWYEPGAECQDYLPRPIDTPASNGPS